MIASTIERGLARLASALRREDGQTLVEYALVGMLVVLSLVVVLTIFDDAITRAIVYVGSAL